MLSDGISFVVITLLFGAMLMYLPDAKIAWRDVLVGALVTSVLFSVGKFALSRYLSQGNFASQFSSAAASMAILFVWIYYSAVIFLFGAEFTQVWARRSGREIEPESGAVRIIRKPANEVDSEGHATTAAAG